jgi:tripartite ATP-independent transporter DctM subunit
MVVASLAALLAVGTIPLLVIPQIMIHGLSKFELLAVPFFILAAEIMNAGGLTDRIFRFALALVGWMPGGLAQVNVVGSVVFAGISGTAMADAAGLGRVEIKAMRDAGYDGGFACAVTLASCIIGPLVPPSVVMIIYAITAEVSVGAMLLAGVGPGLVLAALLMIFVFILARSGTYACPVVPLASGRELWRCLLEGAPALIAPLIIMAGIVGGVFTATEAGIAACLYSLLISVFVYRELTLRRLAQVIVRATLSSSMIMFLIACASVMAWLVTREQVAAEAASWVADVSRERWVQLLVIDAFLLVVGCLIEGLPALRPAGPPDHDPGPGAGCGGDRRRPGPFRGDPRVQPPGRDHHAADGGRPVRGRELHRHLGRADRVGVPAVLRAAAAYAPDDHLRAGVLALAAGAAAAMRRAVRFDAFAVAAGLVRALTVLYLWAAGALFLLGLALYTAEIVLRYGFDSGIPEYYELVGIGFIYVFLLGAAALYARSEDIVIDLIYARLPARAQAWLELAVQVAIVATMIVVAVQAWRLAVAQWNIPTPLLQVPEAVKVLPLVVGAASIALASAVEAWACAMSIARGPRRSIWTRPFFDQITESEGGLSS